MDKIKTTKDHHYQQFARKDLLATMFVTLGTTHLLMSALNAVVCLKAVVLGEEEKKVRCEMDQIKQQRTTTNIKN